MAENMQFPIPNEILEPYIKQAVSTAIASALGDGTNLIEGAVSSALAIKVGSNGQVSKYSSDNRYLLVEVLARNKIAEVARETINEMAEQMRPAIKSAIQRQLKAKHQTIAKALVDGMIESLTSKWTTTIKFSGE